MSLNPGDSDSRLNRLHRLVDEFYAREPRHELHFQMLKKSLEADQPFQEPATMLPSHEAEIRRDFAIKLEAAIRAKPVFADFRLNAAQLATILSVPLFTLQPGGYLAPQDSGGQPNNEGTLRGRLIKILDLVDHFLRPSPEDNKASDNRLPESSPTPRNPSNHSTPRKKLKTSSNLSSTGSRKGSNKHDQPDAEYQPKPKNRSNTQPRDCRARDDDACVLMRTNDPHVCHIIPFSWNNSYQNLGKTRDVFMYAEAFLGRAWMTEFEPLIQDFQNLGSSDKIWNMICLNIQMHAWWSKARFGLKCIGFRPTTKGESVVTRAVASLAASARAGEAALTVEALDHKPIFGLPMMQGLSEPVRRYQNDGRHLHVVFWVSSQELWSSW
ncbi:hypothetical protein NW759_004582 [Fusarium solani]|nr:hypothetical protein NW759_004582 [Fusarium solani]